MQLALLGAASQGILWGIMVLGVFVTFRMLDIADLTTMEIGRASCRERV